MAFGDVFETMQEGRVARALSQIESAKTEEEKRRVITQTIKQLSNAVAKAVQDSLGGGMDVNNFDEVKAMFRNELRKVAKPLLAELKTMGVSNAERNDILDSMGTRSLEGLTKDFSFFMVPKPATGNVVVLNLDEIQFPEEMAISNFQEMVEQFRSVRDAIMDIRLPTPQVTVQDIEIPEIRPPDVRIPDIDITPISEALIKELKKGFEKLRTNKATNPLAVRLSDGQSWINALEGLVERQEQAVLSFPGKVTLANNSKVQIEGAKSLGDGSQTVSSAGTAVALSSTKVACRRVVVYANEGNTGNIFLGSSSVDSTRGAVLQPGRSETINCRDLRDVYIDAANNNDGVTYFYEN